MSSRIRFAGVTTIAFAVAFALTPGAEAAEGRTTTSGGSRTTASGGSRGGGSSTSSGRVSSGSTSRSVHSSPSRVSDSGRSSGHTTSPAPPRTGSGHEPRGTIRVYRGNSGGHGSGGSWGGHGHGGGGGHWYPTWYPSWYWGFTPYWASYGWLWGWPGYFDPFWSDWRYAQLYGGGGYYGGGWRSSAWASRFGRVKTDVEPDETEVWLNGKYIGTADDFDGFPDYLYLEPGSYKLEFRLGGYVTMANDVNLKRGEVVRLNQELEHEKGHGRLDSFLPESKGVPEGRYFDKSGQPAKPAAPRVRVRVRSSEDEDEDAPVGAEDRKPRTDVDAESNDEEGGEPVEVDVEVEKSVAPESDEESDRKVIREREVVREEPSEAPAARARLRWKVTPDDAAVWVDDKYLGTADELSARPRGITMAPGKHTVTVVRPGYESRTVTVEAEAGEAVDVVVELEK